MTILVRSSALLALTFGATSCCVAEGTWIETPDGRRRVEALAVGDRVWCVDPVTGARHAATLVAVRSARRGCMAIGVRGEPPLMLTEDHPVYSPEHRRYGDARHWVRGELHTVVRTTPDGVTVEAPVTRRADAGDHTVYDLTVDHPLHNFVANGIVVHNKSALCMDPQCMESWEGGEVTSSSEASDGTATTTGDGDGTTGDGGRDDGGRRRDDGRRDDGGRGRDDRRLHDAERDQPDGGPRRSLRNLFGSDGLRVRVGVVLPGLRWHLRGVV